MSISCVSVPPWLQQLAA